VRRYYFIFLLFPSLLTFAQQENYRLERYSTRDGLSHDIVNCLFKDSRGLLWIGTDFGLNMYDGNTFTSFFSIPGDTNSLPHNKILNIKEDNQHRLWIGTQKGISCFDLLTRHFINYSPFNKGPRQFDIENCYSFISRTGVVWIGHNKGIIRLEPGTGRLKSYSLQLSPPGEYRNRYVSDFLENDQGQLWVASSWGIYRLDDEKKGEFISLRFPSSHPAEGALNACTDLTTDRNGIIYSGTWNAGVIYFDKSSGRFRQLPQLKNEVIFSVLATDKYTLFTGPQGLFYFATSNIIRDTSVVPVKYEPSSSGIAAACIFPDDDFLWVGTNNGLCKLMMNNTAVSNYSYSNINNWNTLSMIENEAGQLDIFNGLALMRYDLNKRNVIFHRKNLHYASQMTTAKDGGYWLTQLPGIYKLDKQLNVVKTITHTDEKGTPEYFGAVYEDSKGMLWLSKGRDGLRLYDPVTKKWQQHFTGSEIRFSQFASDEFDNVWIAGRLTRYNRKTGAFEKMTIRNPLFDSLEVNSITAVCPDMKGKVWISTYAGLYYYDYASNSIVTVPVPATISARIDGLLADNNNHLWLESLGKLVMYDIAKKIFRVIGEADGFTGAEMSSRFTLLKNGNVAVGYNGGFAIIDPSVIRAVTTTPLPQFTSVTIGNTPIDNTSATPVLSYDQSISFQFVSPFYTPGEKAQYSYQLVPVDKTWNNVGNNTNLRFANLPAGKYKLMVRSATASGLWNEQPAIYEFVIRPPFWKTWWFISGLVLVITGSLFAFYRYRVQQLVKMERMRTRIATDLHDDIGATLSSISMYSDALKQQVKEKLPHLEPVLDKMGENSRDMVNSMSDIVWAINPNNDDGSKLIQRMESYAIDLCSMKNVLLQFRADETINSMNLPLEYRKNIYLIFKESLNNALKYSGAKQIQVSVGREQGKFSMIIEDNGSGFDTHKASNGNGLINIVERAKEIKGQSVVDSAVGSGTKVVFNCPLP
jgi:ligand-binding sensor domain-containing protein/two-component sensor histidine kinase